MSVIVPTVMPTTGDPHVFREIVEGVTSYARRIHIDLMDGDFAPHRNLAPGLIWWPEGVVADVHLMYRRPIEVIEDVVLDSTIVLLDIHLDGARNYRTGRIDTGYELFHHSCALFKQGIEVNPFGIHLLNRLVNQLIGSGIGRKASSF